MSKVAVLGLGAMGARIAQRLIDAGHDLVVWNRSPEKMEPLTGRGADPATTPAEALRDAEVVITVTADPSALSAIVDGPTGISAGINESATLIEMSTVGPAAVAWLRDTLPSSVGLLDAPVLGSISEAESGSLRIFVGGPEALVARWTPLLSALGAPLHVGELGLGAAAKLVANTTLFTTLGIVGEAVALADGLGLAREITYDVLSGTPIAAQAERRRDAIEADHYEKRFSLALARKDADLIQEAAAAARLNLPLNGAARSWLVDAEDAGWGERDYSSVVARIIEQS